MVLRAQIIVGDMNSPRRRSGPTKYNPLMLTFHWIAGGILGALWLWRLIEAAIGLPRVTDITRPEWEPNAEAIARFPRVTIVVPAKDEAECIEQCLTSLLNLDYPDFEIIAVDDRSTDDTGKIMDRLDTQQTSDKLKVIHVRDLPQGWLGKTHAMWLAAKQGTGEWILFTDGDIVFRADTLRRVMNYLCQKEPDHLVLFPTMLRHSAGESMMLGFFQALFASAVRAQKIPQAGTRDHVGVGAFNLVRRTAYEKLGTYEALRLEVIDDLKLGKAIKAHGFVQNIVFGHGLISLRWGRGALGVVGNLTKNIFALLQYRWWLALAAAITVAYLNIWPFVGIWFAPGLSKLGYAVALCSIASVYLGMWRISKVPPGYFVTHPISSALFIFTLLRSTWLTLSQGGVTWRGTKYSVKELREALR
jgi:glycosyltransferase involved in cell wall biosynthesis